MDKSALSSKKFWALLLATLGWDVLLAYAIYAWVPLDQWGAIVLLAMVVTQGVVQVGYILGQAGLDALTRLFDAITPDSVFGKSKAKKDDLTDL